MAKGQEIVLYKRNKGNALEVKILNDTIWMPQKDIALLYGTQRPAITKHLTNIFKSGELENDSVCSILELTAIDGKKYKTKYYNLDAIISIGYRVNSIEATQFRIWATKVLKEKILKIKDRTRDEKDNELSKLIDFISNITSGAEISGDEAKGLLKVIVDYKYALETLDKFDHRTLQIIGLNQKTSFKISFNEAMKSIDMLRKKFVSSDLFGIEKDHSFKSSLSTIYQTFDGKELYPSIEEKAAHLLYFITKNHSFIDGNKRIAAFLFVLFMDKNNFLYDEFGNKRIADNALVALTLMIAESNPKDKDLIIKVIINLINKKN